MPDESASGARGRFLYLNHANRGHRTAFGLMHIGGRVTHIDVVAVEEDDRRRPSGSTAPATGVPTARYSVLVEDHGEGRRDGDDNDDHDNDGEVDDDGDGRHRPGTGPRSGRAIASAWSSSRTGESSRLDRCAPSPAATCSSTSGPDRP